MATIAFALPLSAGKSEAFRTAQHRFVEARRAEFEASRRRLGVRSERGFLQRTPAGDLAVVVFDVDDPVRLFEGIASSPERLDVDFRGYLREAFGLDVTQAPTGAPSELVFEWDAPEMVAR